MLGRPLPTRLNYLFNEFDIRDITWDTSVPGFQDLVLPSVLICKQSLGLASPFRDNQFIENEQDHTAGPGYRSAFEVEYQPACRLTPNPADGVSQAPTLLVSLDCQVAVRASCHVCCAGSSNIQDGVTIDLSALITTQVSADRSYTHVGSGARWGDL